jgi:hypothetical protein
MVIIPLPFILVRQNCVSLSDALKDLGSVSVGIFVRMPFKGYFFVSLINYILINGWSDRHS